MDRLEQSRVASTPARRLGAGGIAVPFALLVLFAGAAPVDDGRIAVAVLPVDVTAAPTLGLERALELRGTMERSVQSSPGFKTLELPAALISGDGCERNNSCIDAHLPRGALVLDLRITDGERAGSPPAFDLRVLGGGRVVLRKSAFSAAPDLFGAVALAVVELLGHHRPEIELFERALEGDARAKELLLRRHPDGAWTRSLLLFEAAERQAAGP